MNRGDRAWVVHPRGRWRTPLVPHDRVSIAQRRAKTRHRAHGMSLRLRPSTVPTTLRAPAAPGIQNKVVSRTLRPEDCPGAILSDDAERVIADLRAKPGRDVALSGGGELFRSLLAVGLVDEVAVSVIPVLLGGRIPLLPPPADRARLELKKHRVYAKTGTVALEYDIVGR
jgi:dihydrofolate reductase